MLNPVMLADSLDAAPRRIARSKKLNADDTKATLVDPILATLGWAVLDWEEVAREDKPPRANPIGYEFLVMREPTPSKGSGTCISSPLPAQPQAAQWSLTCSVDYERTRLMCGSTIMDGTGLTIDE